MRRPTLTAVALIALCGPQARAAGCADGVRPSCTGEATRATQPYKFGAVRPALVKAGRPVAAGTRYCFVGESRIGRKLWLYVANSDLMFAGADVALPTGCRLDSLDTSEPD